MQRSTSRTNLRSRESDWFTPYKRFTFIDKNLLVHGRICRSGYPFLTDFLPISTRSRFNVDSVVEVC